MRAYFAVLMLFLGTYASVPVPKSSALPSLPKPDSLVVVVDEFVAPAPLLCTPSMQVERILQLVPDLSFDEGGNLLGAVQSDVALQHQSPVEEVFFLIHHFDGAPSPTFENGSPRTARNTVFGLSWGNTSVHWVVDGGAFPGDEDGFGILQTLPSEDINHPLGANHIYIGVGPFGEDTAYLQTFGRFEELEIDSNLVGLIRQGRDLRGNALKFLSVGYEQVGSGFSREFPENFPSNQQIANSLGLTLVVSRQFGLSPWDNLGHQEVQDKIDPGDEFMATIRFLMVVADSSLLDGDSLQEFLSHLESYTLDRMGQDRFEQWDRWIGFYDYQSCLSSFPKPG